MFSEMSIARHWKIGKIAVKAFAFNLKSYNIDADTKHRLREVYLLTRKIPLLYIGKVNLCALLVGKTKQNKK